jgi:hypothetical protein
MNKKECKKKLAHVLDLAKKQKQAKLEKNSEKRVQILEEMASELALVNEERLCN